MVFGAKSRKIRFHLLLEGWKLSLAGKFKTSSLQCSNSPFTPALDKQMGGNFRRKRSFIAWCCSVVVTTKNEFGVKGEEHIQKAEFAKCKFMHFILCHGLAHNHHLLLPIFQSMIWFSCSLLMRQWWINSYFHLFHEHYLSEKQNPNPRKKKILHRIS